MKVMRDKYAVEVSYSQDNVVLYHMKNYMGIDIRTNQKVGETDQNDKSFIVLHNAEINNKKLKVVESVFYSDNFDVLSSTVSKLNALYYSYVRDVNGCEIPNGRKLRFLFIVSPASGKGKAVKMFHECKRYFE